MTIQYIEDATTGVPDNKNSWVRVPTSVSSVGSPWNLVNDRFDKTAEFAETSFDYTTDFISHLEDLLKEVNDYEVPDIEVDLPERFDIDIKARPNMSELNLDTTNWPKNTAGKPSLVDLPDIPGVEIPSLTATPPSYLQISPPDIKSIKLPEGPPSLAQPVLPVEPDYVLPDPPTLGDLKLPEVPDIQIPIFDKSLKDITIEIPVPESFAWQESPYNSEIWSSFLVKVRDGIINGGTGLNPEVEQAIFDRAKYRQLIENDKAYREVEHYFSARGYELPPGAMASRLAEVTVEILRANTDLNEKVMIEQAKLAQDNTHFMLEMGRQAEVILREFHNAQEDRTLEAAKAVVALSVDVINAHISRQNVHIEVYKAEVAIYGELVRAALSQVELFKAQVDGVKVSAEVQRVQVEIYKAQVGVAETAARIYSIRLEGTKILQQLEALKIEVYKAEIDIYSASIAAEKTKIDIYSAKIEAEKIKAITYGEQIKAHVSEIDARKTELGIQIAKLTAASQHNSAELDRYKTELGAYQIEVDTKAKVIGANVDAYRADVTAYIAENSAHESYYSIKMKEMDVSIQEAQFNLTKAVAEVETTTQAYVSLKELEVKGTEGVMSVSAQLAASALSAVHASASYGYSGSTGLNHSFSYGAQISESHSVPHDPPQ